ncbi:MAG: hypothetical protein ISS33_05255 [Candidatus Omnitrophica bacterium]|nr:hypothetical protein [Candidatus Omnitrophota bacterium]
MRKTCRVISIVLLLSFLLNTTIYDTHACPDIPICSISKPTIIDELAAGSMCNEILGRANKDRGDLMLALETNLMHFAGAENKEIDSDKLLESAGKYRGSIFDKTHFFFSEKMDLPGDDVYVKCRIKDDKKYKNRKIPSTRTYHAVFSTKRDEQEGFDVEVYTDEEWEGVLLGETEDMWAVERYVEHNREIDRFIKDRIKEKNFMEFIDRAKDLGWDEEYPDRTRPKEEYLLPERVWEYVKAEGVEDILKGFDTNSYKALEGKNIVFIRVPSDVPLPVIHEAGREISVTTHASQNAVYVFLEEDAFDTLCGLSAQEPQANEAMDEYLKIRETLRGNVIERLLHVIGKAHNFEIFYDEEKNEIRNAMDIAWDEFQEPEEVYFSYENVNDEVLTSLGEMFKGRAEDLMKEHPDLKKLKNGPVDLDTNLRTRVYGGGFSNLKNSAKFLFKHTFTENELERIIEMYETKDWDNVNYKKWNGIRNKLVIAITPLNPKKIFKTHSNDWPKLDSIGGIETLYTALSIKRAGISYWDVKTKNAHLSSLPNSELKRAALLERDMRNILKEKVGMNENLSLSNIAVDLYARRLKTINDMRKLNRITIRRNPSVFDSQPYDNIFDFSGITLKTFAEKDPILIPCSSRMKDGKEKKYGVLIDFSVSEKRVIVTALTEEEADAVKHSKKYIKNFKRSAEDRRIMESFLEHEDKIDAVIALAIKENRYANIQTNKSALLDSITTELTELFYAINGEKDKKYYKNLLKKMIGETYTLINVGKESNLPQIRIKLTNGDERMITVRMHTGARGRYIFLTDDEYASLSDLYYGKDGLKERTKKKMKRWIVHDAGGVGFGLPATKVANDKRVINDLDCVYENWLRSKEEKKDYVYDETSYWPIKRILAADNPIVDIEDLRGRNKANDLYYRDYAAGYLANLFKKIPTKSHRETKRKENAKEFVRKTGSFTTDDLELLIDAYGDQQSYKSASAHFKSGLGEEEYKKFQAVFVKLRKTLEAIDVKVEVISHQDLRPKIGKIGGVETLEEALNLRQKVEKLTIADTRDLKQNKAEFNSLPGAELKTAALLAKNLQMIMFKAGISAIDSNSKYLLLKYGLYGTEDCSKKYDEVIKKLVETRNGGSSPEIFNRIVRDNLEKILGALWQMGRKTVAGNFEDNTFELSNITTDSPEGMLFVRCHGSLTCKQYIAAVDFRQKDRIDIQILTPGEAELLQKMDAYGIDAHFVCSAEDRRCISEYLLHEERIDDLVSGAIDKGKFHIIPKNDDLLKDVARKMMHLFKKITGKTNETYEKLAKKIISSPYILINVGAESNLPRMPVKIKEKTKEITVRMHTGPRGKYIFLTDKEFKSFHRYGDSILANKIEQDIIGWMIHDAGEVNLGLSIIGVEDGNIMNELDYASKGLDLGGKPIDKSIGYSKESVKSEISEIYAKTFPTLKKILNAVEPIVNIHDLKGKNAAEVPYTRGYTAGKIARQGSNSLPDMEKIFEGVQLNNDKIKNYWKQLDGVNDPFTLEALLKVFKYGDEKKYTDEERKLISRGGPDLSSFEKLQKELQENEAGVFLQYKIGRIEGSENKTKKQAKAVGMITAPPGANHTLFVLNDFVSGSEEDASSEYGEDIIDYGSRFGIKKISTDKPKKIVKSILYDIKKGKLKSKNVIVQLPVVFSEEKYVSEIKKLQKKAPGIKFMIVDPAGIKNEDIPEKRKKYRRRMYSIMCLVGKLGRCRNEYEELRITEFLETLVKPFLKDAEGKIVPTEKYIKALKSGKISDIVNITLSCMPVTILPMPDYDEVVHIFTFA